MIVDELDESELEIHGQRGRFMEINIIENINYKMNIKHESKQHPKQRDTRSPRLMKFYLKSSWRSSPAPATTRRDVPHEN